MESLRKQGNYIPPFRADSKSMESLRKQGNYIPPFRADSRPFYILKMGGTNSNGDQKGRQEVV